MPELPAVAFDELLVELTTFATATDVTMRTETRTFLPADEHTAEHILVKPRFCFRLPDPLDRVSI